MLELIVEDLNRKKVARVKRTSLKTYKIVSTDSGVEETITTVIGDAQKKGIPLRSDKRQRTTTGVKFQRLARWVMPDDDDFLEALAEYLSKYELFSYTIESPTKLTSNR